MNNQVPILWEENNEQTKDIRTAVYSYVSGKDFDEDGACSTDI